MTIITCKSGTEINLEASIEYEVDPELAEAINIYIDQLRARVAELEDCARKIDSSFSEGALENALTELQNITYRQPSQSLAAIEARVLRNAADELDDSDVVARSYANWLRRKADRIKAEGKV